MSLQGKGDLRIAIIVNPTLSSGQAANTVATIGIGLGAGQTGFGNVTLSDRAGLSFLTSADRPVPVLQAAGEAMQDLMSKAHLTLPDSGGMVLFPSFARLLHSFDDYRNAIPMRDLKEEQIDGIGLFGPTRWVKSLTGSLKLHQ
ncbi:MAG: DUF2000 domain-containing protein [Roseibium sp.]|uniref:DUF2000 domain-containing protein n=1 Tax=Roseibium sp. TaxID=1936156 RepID=UPI0026267BDE|nr:DUF2000 domain-containing protein [Roseibium sp.]MCV0429524.1 DUF2000 domain-containing protein [Roseibium sp.]